MLLVTAAALINENKQILITTRPRGKVMAGLWEFPGGKVQEDEMPAEALARELREELNITTSPCCMSPASFITYPSSPEIYDEYETNMRKANGCSPLRPSPKYDPDDMMLLLLYICRRWHGTPSPQEGQKLAWVTLQELRKYQMLPADKPLISFLWDYL